MKYSTHTRRGAATLLGIGAAILVLLFGWFFLELEELHNAQYTIEARAQRAVNSCVEYSMDDNKRADGENIMDVHVAQSTYKQFLDESLGVNSSGIHYGSNGEKVYQVQYSSPEFSPGGSGTLPSMKIKITVYLYAGLGKMAGLNGYEWTQSFVSQNNRTD